MGRTVAREGNPGRSWGASLRMLRARDVAALAFVVLLFASVGFRLLGQPGLYADEAFSATHAARWAAGSPVVGANPGGQVMLFGRPWPLMVNAYIGPVKPLLVGVGFMIFGISVLTLRATTAGLGLVAVVLVYGMVRGRFGSFAAFSAAALLATDLSFLLAVRSDWGPLAFSLAASAGVAWLLLLWQRRPQRVWPAALAGLLSGLGLAHKLDFLVCVASLLVALACTFPLTLRRAGRAGLVAAACLLAGASPVVLYNIESRGQTFREGSTIARSQGHHFPPSRQDLAGLGGDVVRVARGLGQMLGGYPLADWMLGRNLVPQSPLGRSKLAAALLISPAFLLLLLTPGMRGWRRPLAFFGVALLASLVFLAAVPFARGPHHFLLVYPLPHVVVGTALGALWASGGRWRGWRRASSQGAAVVALVALLLPSVMLGRAFQTAVSRDGGRGYWSAEALDSLVATLDGPFVGRTVTLLDWGFEQSLVIVAKDRLRLDAAYWGVLASPEPERAVARLVGDPGRVFVVHAPGFEGVGARAQAAFSAYVARTGLRLTETRIFQKDGKHYCSILAVEPR
jgi:hypothetical protein